MVPGRCLRRVVLAAVAFLTALMVGASSAQLGTCGPFTDTADDAFCPFVLEIFCIGITTGVTPTTYDPSGNVSRLQMAAFLSRTVDATLRRGNRRALLRKFWTPQTAAAMGTTTFGPLTDPEEVACDGRDVWVSSLEDGTVWRVQGSSGKLLDTWTADSPYGLAAVNGRILVAGHLSPGRLYRIDPTLPPGAAAVVSSNLGSGPNDVASDGSRFWTTNDDGSISIVTPQASIPWTVTTVTTGSLTAFGLLYDGSNIWARGHGALYKLDSNGAILLTITVGSGTAFPVFDGTNIWAPDDNSNSIAVVRVSSGAVLATLTGNGIGGMKRSAFDGERVLVTNGFSGTVSIWKAADLTPLGSVPTGGTPTGACSDGFQFWIATLNRLARF